MATIGTELKNPKNRPWIIGAGALTAGVLGYAWWTRGQSEAAAAAERALAQIPGPVEEPTDEPGFDIIGGTTTEQPATNDQWTSLAVERLVNQGWEGMAVQSALGKFLGRQPLSSAEADIVRAALAVAGQPPVGGPFSVITVQTPAAVPMGAPVLSATAPVYRNGAWEYVISWAPVTGATRYWFQHVGGSSGFITATQTSVIRAAAGRTDTWKFAAVNAAGVKGPEATFTKAFPTAPVAPAATKPPGNPNLVILTSLGGNRYRVSVGPYIMVPVTQWRVRWEAGSRVSGWAIMPHTKDFVWNFPRGTRFRVRVQAGNKAGYSSPGKLSNTVSAR